MKLKKEGLDPLSIKKYWKNLLPPQNLEYLQKTKGKFIDQTFPPTRDSLFSKYDNENIKDKIRFPEKLNDSNKNIKDKDIIIWKRVTATDLYPKWKVFEGEIEYKDVQQGSLGDCYFLSSIATLTKYPKLIYEKFRTKSFNEEGYYEVIFFIDGEWQIIFIDDWFPYDTSKNIFAFAKPNNNELWAMLLEKAWAKLNGGYSNIIGGIVSDPLTALTGFPTEFLYHEDLDESEIYNKIEQGVKDGSIMSSASKNNSEMEKKGLIRSHAYSLISAKSWKERNIYLIKLRNPWGEQEWKGKWGDNSSCWTKEYKNYFGFEKNKDGIFWIDINDYIDNFNGTYICNIFYNAIIKNFYFEYESYFKKPVVFNFRVKEKSKMSISVLFKNRRFNRDIDDLSHPFSIIAGKYDEKRNIKKLWGRWSCKYDLNIVEFFEPGFYVIWMYVPYKQIKDKEFKYTVQVSSLLEFDIEFLGFDRDFLLIQYLLLEKYKKNIKKSFAFSKDCLIDSDGEISKIGGLMNYLIYNKTGKEIQISATGKQVTNVELFPLSQLKGLSNIKIFLPPYESVAIIGIRLTNHSVDFDYKFRIHIPKQDKIEDKDFWKINKGEKFANMLKFNIVNDNPAKTRLRKDEYKYIEKNLAEQMPIFNSSLFDGKNILRKDKINIKVEDGIYAGQINIQTGNLDGKGVFKWKNGKKYIGNWKEGFMHGKGFLFDENNNIIFEGYYLNNKKYGKFFIKEKEYYEGEFLNDKMEGKGCYHYSNGDTWEGYFKNNYKNGIGLMTYNNGEIYLYEFENDNYIGSVPLSQEEKEKVKNLKEEEKKKLFEKKKEEIFNDNNENNENSDYNNNDGLNKFVSKLYLEKSLIDFGATKIEENKEIGESLDEKKYKNFLEQIAIYKRKEPFMVQKFLELKELNYKEDINFIEKEGTKYLGEIIEKNNNLIIKEGKGVLFYNDHYYVGNWNNDIPEGYFYRYSKNKLIDFQGHLLNDYHINHNYEVIKYFHNGDKYKRYFINDKKRLGIYYYSKGDSFTGYFKNGKFDGKGKYFYENGLISEYITYNDGKVVSKFDKNREDLRDPNSFDFFKDIKSKYPNVIEHILEIPPLRDIIDELFWTERIFKNEDIDKGQMNKKFNNGDIYIGQMNSKNELYGRCCVIFSNSSEKYFVGYNINNQFDGEGCYYDDQWNKIYEGNFKNNLKNGFGVLYKEGGTTYAGEFKDDNPHGKGVVYYANSIRFEGNFFKGYKNGKGYLINLKEYTKQEILYDNGNIIKQGEIYDYKKSKYKKIFQREFDEFEKKCKDLEKEKYMNLMMNIKERKDSCLLKKGIIEENGGIYVGEMNSLGLKYGRGVFIDNFNKMYYVGYFINNEKFGKGINYNLSDDKVQSICNYRRNKVCGKGEFRFKNGDILQGKFNSIGVGSGVYIFKNGNIWKGNFYGFYLNGKGEEYDQNGKILGEKTYTYYKPY